MVNYEKALKNALRFSFNRRKFLPYLLINLIILSILVFSGFNTIKTTDTLSEDSVISESLLNNMAIMGIGILIAVLISILLRIIYIHNYSKSKLTIMESFAKMKSRYPTALIVAVIILMVSTVFSKIQIIGWIASIIISLIVFFVYQEIVLKKKGVKKSIKQSWYLFRKYPVTIFATYVISTITALAIVIVLALPLIMVGASIFIPFITEGVLNFDGNTNIMLLGITGLIAATGVTIASIFSIAIKTDVYMQLAKKKRLL